MADVDRAARPFVYVCLEQSGRTWVGHLDASCRDIKGDRRLDDWTDRDAWPCSRCISLEQLAHWARRTPLALARGWGRSRGRAAAEILPAKEIVSFCGKTLYSGGGIADNTSRQPDNTTEDTTMNRTNDLTPEIMEGLKNAFATAARYGVPGVEDFRQATLKCYRLGDLTAELAQSVIDTYTAAAAVKAQAEMDASPAGRTS